MKLLPLFDKINSAELGTLQKFCLHTSIANLEWMLETKIINKSDFDKAILALLSSFEI
jgi:hypothetical protein